MSKEPNKKSLFNKFKGFFEEARENEKAFRESDMGKMVYSGIISGLTFFGISALVKRDKK